MSHHHKGGRKPVDQQQPSECRQAAWEEIRAQRAGFCALEITHATRLKATTVRDYITGLCNAGYLVKIHRPMPESFKTQYYRLERDAGHHAPRVRKDGSEVTQGKSRLHMWRVMPVVKVFTSLDLAYSASTPEHKVSEYDAKDYIRNLHHAGYLVPAKAAKPGHKQAYRLKPGMWTGPHPPQIQRTRQVYDPNLQRVVWATVTGGAE